MVSCAAGRGWVQRTQPREARGSVGHGELPSQALPPSPEGSWAWLWKLMRNRLRSGTGQSPGGWLCYVASSASPVAGVELFLPTSREPGTAMQLDCRVPSSGTQGGLYFTKRSKHRHLQG